MSQKELGRVGVMARVKSGDLKLVDAAQQRGAGIEPEQAKEVPG
jgi:hypothetical protein